MNPKTKTDTEEKLIKEIKLKRKCIICGKILSGRRGERLDYIHKNNFCNYHYESFRKMVNITKIIEKLKREMFQAGKQSAKQEFEKVLDEWWLKIEKSNIKVDEADEFTSMMVTKEELEELKSKLNQKSEDENEM